MTDEGWRRRFVRSFVTPDEVIELDKLRSERIILGGMTVSRDIQYPGWRWSTHVKPRVGTEWCQSHHLGLMLSGRLHAQMEDGTEFEVGPMDVTDIPPGHDAWVVGDEPAVTLGWTGVEGWLSPPDADRVLVTVLFTDIVGSTDVAARLGGRAWVEKLGEHHRLTRALLERYRGTEVDTTGDGFFATFDSPARAVRCARAIVQSVQPLGLEIRAGIHTGEVDAIDGKAGGLAVVIGARIGALASASETLVSQTVKDLTAGSGLAFQDAGEHELKGVPDRWRLYRVVEAEPVTGTG